MDWNGEEFSRRLDKISYDTMLLISDIIGTGNIRKAVTKIIMENDTETAEKKIRELLKHKM